MDEVTIQDVESVREVQEFAERLGNWKHARDMHALRQKLYATLARQTEQQLRERFEAQR